MGLTSRVIHLFVIPGPAPMVGIVEEAAEPPCAVLPMPLQ